jgi:hypothetical protein
MFLALSFVDEEEMRSPSCKESEICARTQCHGGDEVRGCSFGTGQKVQ